jgi:hypothetical protein
LSQVAPGVSAPSSMHFAVVVGYQAPNVAASFMAVWRRLYV